MEKNFLFSEQLEEFQRLFKENVTWKQYGLTWFDDF